MSYIQNYNHAGEFIGVIRDDGAVIPNDPLNGDWRDFLAWNDQQQVPLSLEDLPGPTLRVPRHPLEIRADLLALTAPQRTAIWNQLQAGSPPRWAQNEGSGLDAMSAHQIIGELTTGAVMQEARVRMAAIYTRDNPYWLVNPPFDPTINVPGDEPV